MIFNSIRLVVLDMAGTTVNDTFAVHDSMVRAFIDHKLTIDRKIASAVLAIPKQIGIRLILSEHFHLSDETKVKSIHNSFLEHINSYYKFNENVCETKDTSKLFVYLRDRKIKIVLDTGFNKETADLIVERLAWNSLIDGLVCSDDPTIGRPKPGMIYKAMEITGVSESAHVVKIGDTPNDIMQGKNANCKWSIGVNSGAFSSEDLITAGADFVVCNPYEIVNYKNI